MARQFIPTGRRKFSEPESFSLHHRTGVRRDHRSGHSCFGRVLASQWGWSWAYLLVPNILICSKFHGKGELHGADFHPFPNLDGTSREGDSPFRTESKRFFVAQVCFSWCKSTKLNISFKHSSWQHNYASDNAREGDVGHSSLVAAWRKMTQGPDQEECCELRSALGQRQRFLPGSDGASCAAQAQDSTGERPDQKRARTPVAPLTWRRRALNLPRSQSRCRAISSDLHMWWFAKNQAHGLTCFTRPNIHQFREHG